MKNLGAGRLRGGRVGVRGPRPGGGHGWILTTIYDEARDTSCLAALDAYAP